MAARLTDKQKKRIIADYVELGSYNAVAKKHKVADSTVKRIVQSDPEMQKNAEQKKQENTVDILAHMQAKKDVALKVVDRYLDALLDEERISRANPAQLTTAMGTVLDKFAQLDEKSAGGNDLMRDAWANFWQCVGPAFLPVVGDVMSHRHTHYDESGGRGSLKSSYISLVVPMLIMTHPNTHALVLRKVSNTLRDSVFAQYLWALDKLGVLSEWDSKVSPMELVYKPTGQKILFRGADDPAKIKSIKVPFGYIAVTHFEEKDQFAGRQEIRTILQSTMRGGDKFWNFESYNPPISRDNWANKDSLIERPDRLCHKSTYLEAPPEWLGDQFLAEAEHLRETDDRAYRHEYLGEATGTGGNVFENIEVRVITDDEIKSFDRIYQGVDWGWFPDPFAFVRIHYDKARETIYFIDELYANKLTNEASAAKIKEKKYTDAYITCDSAENKSVADYRALGLPAKAAIQGPGSVEYGMKWLARRKLVIDPRRTPNVHKEFLHYEYERNKDGEIISGYPDKDNHLIDATRYALERVYRQMGVTA